MLFQTAAAAGFDVAAVTLQVDPGTFQVFDPIAFLAYVPLVLQAFDPIGLLGSSAPARAMLAFLASTLAGGAVMYWYGNRIEDAVAASAESLPLSAVYGVIAYGLITFFGAYAFSQVSRLAIGASAASLVSGLLVLALLLGLGGFGYVVIGSWVADSAGFRDPWLGLVGVGLVGAAAVLVLPLAYGAVVWFGIAAVGIGGPVRRWVHADNADRQARES